MIKTYFVGAVIGFIVGIFVARFYFKTSIRQRELGRVIECAMIQKNVSNLESLSNTLNQLVSEIQEESEVLSNQMKLAQDIELNLRPNHNKIDEIQEKIITEEGPYVSIEVNNNVNEITSRTQKNLSRMQ
jgi:hypothetical protein